MPTAKEMIEFVQKTYKPDEVVAFDVYNVADVLSYCKDIGRDDVDKATAENALECMHERKDCNDGYNWDVLMENIPSREELAEENEKAILEGNL